jgi:hypothetical protein
MTAPAARWRNPETLLLLMAAAAPLSFATWMALLNNFAIERAAFSGAEMGVLQSLREIPGFLAFAVVFVILIMREQTLAFWSLLLLGLGTAITGVFPTVVGLYITTVIMSLGFHYYATMETSLALQWLPKERAPEMLGKIIAAGSFTSLAAYAIIFLGLKLAGLDYAWVYAAGGGLTIAMALLAWFAFPKFPARVKQRKTLVLRRRYWLFYGLTFLSGARRQIFVVFAGFLMVEKFGYSAAAITLLYLVNCGINIWLAPKIGRLIARWGERRALTFEYIGLVGLFTAYAFVQNATVAASLYIIDHLFFALAIAIDTYFQKIADPADIAASAGVSFTINHIAAVVLPAVLGIVWLVSPPTVFLTGAALAMGSLLLSRLVPTNPAPGNEAQFGLRALAFGRT